MKNGKFTKTEKQELESAVVLLENPSFIMKALNVIGKPIEKSMNLLPEKASEKVSKVVHASLMKGLDYAIVASDYDRIKVETKIKNKVLGGISGFAGGFFGFPGLVVELPISTLIMLKSILEIAKAEGEDLGDLEARLSCLEVFAFGGRTVSDDGAETGYYAVRNGLASLVKKSADYIVKEGIEAISEKSAPTLLRLIAQIAERFGISVTEKGMTQAIPVIGALGGAAINLIFINHFEDMAKGHFTIRRLERKYGKELVESEYSKIAKMLNEN